MWHFLDGLERDLGCQRLTLANAQAGRPELKNLKYVRLHDAVESAVREYDRTENKILYLRKLANLQ